MLELLESTVISDTSAVVLEEAKTVEIPTFAVVLVEQQVEGGTVARSLLFLEVKLLAATG